MALVNATQVATYFREIIDEPDTTFIDGPRAQRFLEMGSEEYRRMIADLDPEILVERVTINLANAREYDLSADAVAPEVVTILGEMPTNARMVRLIDIESVDANGDNQYILESVTSLKALRNAQIGLYWRELAYLLTRSSVLMLSSDYNGLLRLNYVPEDPTDWSLTGPIDTEYISDNLTEYHDLIALLAAKHYHIMDQSTNEQLERQLKQRKDDFMEYTQRRNYEAPRFVGSEWEI